MGSFSEERLGRFIFFLYVPTRWLYLYFIQTVHVIRSEAIFQRLLYEYDRLLKLDEVSFHLIDCRTIPFVLQTCVSPVYWASRIHRLQNGKNFQQVP